MNDNTIAMWYNQNSISIEVCARQNLSNISIYTNGYKEGFIAALNEVNQCITDLPNNKERLTAISKMIKEYDKN